MGNAPCAEYLQDGERDHRQQEGKLTVAIEIMWVDSNPCYFRETESSPDGQMVWATWGEVKKEALKQVIRNRDEAVHCVRSIRQATRADVQEG
ncbi:hypothetical protein ABT282_08125 [Streptomyces sp. NPDC000927]|uniref:hypothetical protein n=1 Tax=Streptomyces sp. NPDC000927 TaxID=3154371 RepID=UPI00332D8F03